MYKMFLNWIADVFSIRSVLLVLAMLFWAMRLSAQSEGEGLFKSTCAVCHTITNTRLVGPGLANVDKKRSEDWLINFIKDSQSMVQAGDAEAVTIFEEYSKLIMPNHDLNDIQIKSIIAYIAENSPAIETEIADAGGTVTTEAPVEPEQPTREITESDIQRGQNLFVGKINFTNGGPTCNACHHVTTDKTVTGGALAKDLTEVHARMGTAGIGAILGNSPFPAMNQAYEGKPLTADEIFQLTAFLINVNEDKFYQHPRDYGQRMLWTGIIGAFIIMGVFPALWYNRKSKSVNQRIYDRQAKSFN